MFTPPHLQAAFEAGDGGTLALVVFQDEEGDASLGWIAYYQGDDWIFMESIQLKVDDTIYEIDSFSRFDVESDIFLGGVRETVTRRYSERDHDQILAALLTKTSNAVVRLDGDDGNVDTNLNEVIVQSFFAARSLVDQINDR